ncbi:MAG TPA: signal peptidase I [Clostridiales bacterium]|nr:signal peptidase I [Clostridiales bacterium]
MVIVMDYNFDEENKKSMFIKIIREIFIWGLQIAAVVFLAYFIVYYTVEKTDMVGSSMEETLYDGDSIIINKFSYRFTEPQRFDVIVFKQTGKEHGYYNIKRIIGLPGETLQFKDDNIYINGVIVEEKVSVKPMINYGLASEEITLEDNEYFVLGDNRNNSEDSRFASIANIRREEIIGKASLRLSPFNFVNKLNLKQEDSD